VSRSRRRRTQVIIIGAGPAGLLLAQVLHEAAIESVVLEKHARAHVEGRIRAGILERGTVEMLGRAKADARLKREALSHDGIEIAFAGQRQRIDFKALAGALVTVYGQSELTKDLADRRAEIGGETVYGADEVALGDLCSSRPAVSYMKDGQAYELSADFIAGCDGFHGVSRPSIPLDALRIYERAYPFAWLGVMVDAPPPADVLLYARHARGFALCSMRSRIRGRHYLQVGPETELDQWTPERIFEEIAVRIGDDGRTELKQGPLLEKSLTTMRSFVCETMRFGRLFLVGDAAHIVPPTGAKGLNLAAGDVHYLSEALMEFYRHGETSGLDAYEGRALRRVWKAQRFSQWMTALLHDFAAVDAFQDRIHRAELDYVLSSKSALASLAENYVGLPY